VKFFFSRIFPLIFITVGAGAAFFGGRELARARASADWPFIRGEVVGSSVERHHGSESKGGGTTYHAEILYEFAVGGAVFNGNRVAYGDYGSSNPAHARRLVNRYPEGRSVVVHYMPGNPEECLLEPGLKGQAWLLPGLGLVFFAAGSLMAVFLPKAMRTQTVAREVQGGGGDAASRASETGGHRC